MTKTVKDLMAAAHEATPRITPAEMLNLVAQEDALLLDVRDPNEVAQSGKLKGAKNVSRGMLEFRADAGAPSHDPDFRKDRPVVVYCASGGRAALAGKTLKEMGFEKVHNLGGFKDAAESGCETEPHDA